MLKVEYFYNGEWGELELDSLIGFDSMDEVQREIGKCQDLPICVSETLLSKLAPNKTFQYPEIKAQKRGGKRNIISPQEFAKVNGFTKLQHSIGDKIDSIF